MFTLTLCQVVAELMLCQVALDADDVVGGRRACLGRPDRDGATHKETWIARFTAAVGCTDGRILSTTRRIYVAPTPTRAVLLLD